MAGLYIKELILREDVKRCLIVASGGLVEQWQDELYLKFGLAFEIFTPQLGETVFGASAFEQHPHLIARMDQLGRNDDLLTELGGTEWDLVVVDEAHGMGAHYFSGKLEKTKRHEHDPHTRPSSKLRRSASRRPPGRRSPRLLRTSESQTRPCATGSLKTTPTPARSRA